MRRSSRHTKLIRLIVYHRAGLLRPGRSQALPLLFIVKQRLPSQDSKYHEQSKTDRADWFADAPKDIREAECKCSQ